MNRDDAPLCILIAALGGEGGGVLADWIVDCALASNLPVQATSVPGVAQRTGATSYYIELMRGPAPDGARPIFALSPMPGRVDIVLASELLEAARTIERGFVSPDRTALISARHRVYTTIEKMQMGDGRFGDDRIHKAAQQFAKRYLSLDMEGLTAHHRTVISAVMFGALAGSGLLPWPREACEAAIRRGGLGVESSLAGFGAAFDAAVTSTIESALAESASPTRPAPDVWAPLIATLPESTHAYAAHGVARLIDWQDAKWAREYVEHLLALAAKAPDPATATAASEVLAEAARQLALWMSYEDVIRVADLKSRAARFARIRAEARAGDGEIVRIVDYLKPGYEEIAAILPRGIGGALRGWAARGKRTSLRKRGIHLSTTHVAGFLSLRGLARMRPLRRRSLRFHEERQAIAQWLDALGKALPGSPELALQIAVLPRLLKGYGDTWARGHANYTRIFETLVAPALTELSSAKLSSAELPSTELPSTESSTTAAGERARQLRDAIAAALADPEGRRLEDSLERAGIEPLPPKPKPIVWMRKPRTGDESRQIGENPGTVP